VVILFVAIAYVKLLVECGIPVETLLFGGPDRHSDCGVDPYYKAKEGHGMKFNFYATYRPVSGARRLI